MIFFDVDGTLVDSAERHARLLLQLLKQNAVPVPPDCGEEYLRYKADGNNTKHFLKKRLNLGEETAEAIAVAWRKHIEDEELLSMDILYGDAIDTLQSLALTGEEIHFISSRARSDSLCAELSRLQIAQYAQKIHVVNPSDGIRAKIPVIERLISAHHAGERDKQVWIVGDSEADYYPAVELGLSCYLLHRGFRSRAYWEKLNVPTHSGLYDLPSMLRAFT